MNIGSFENNLSKHKDLRFGEKEINLREITMHMSSMWVLLNAILLLKFRCLEMTFKKNPRFKESLEQKNTTNMLNCKLESCHNTPVLELDCKCIYS